MCGIVGYMGPRQAYPIILKGIWKGSNTAVMTAAVLPCWMVPALKLYKKKKARWRNWRPTIGQDVSAQIGIGHTRWATHGEPSDRNAHLHSSASGKLAMIHNRIIENYAQIKRNSRRKAIRLPATQIRKFCSISLKISATTTTAAWKKPCASRWKGLPGPIAYSWWIRMLRIRSLRHVRDHRWSSVSAKGNIFFTSDASHHRIHQRKWVYVNDYELAIVKPDELILKTSATKRSHHTSPNSTWNLLP